MKGKSKSKGGVKNKNAVESDPHRKVPELITTDLRRNCPTFMKVLKKPKDKDICFQELRALQFELEHLLVSEKKRKKQLKDRVQFLETLCARKDKRSKSTDSTEKKSSDERPPKKLKESSNKAHAASTSCTTKSKFIQPPFPESHVEIPKLKNDGPNRFWAYLEPFCVDITQDNINALEDWIKSSGSNAKYLKVPELGIHFATAWPTQDMKEEITEGSKSVESQKGMFSDSADERAEVEEKLKLGEALCAKECDDQYPSMSERLVLTLVEENLMTLLDDTMAEDCDDSVAPQSKPNLPHPSDTGKEDSIKKRLFTELVKNGLLETDDVEMDNDNDEIYLELKRLQSALIPVCEYNKTQKRRLLALAKMEMDRQELKKKLHETDAKVMEVYRAISAARKNKTMNKKLEDQAKRTLRERKKLVEKLNNLYS